MKKFNKKQIKRLEDYFNIDEEVEIHRQNEQYKNDFTISESLQDFTNYLNELKKIYNSIKEN